MRLSGAVAMDLRTQWRYGIIAVAGVLTAGWTAALLVIPADVARTAGPYLLFLDTATFGVFFIAALVLFERTEGALSSLVASPLRTGEYLAAKLATLTALVVAAALPITLAATRDDLASAPPALGRVIPAVALVSLFFLAVSLYLVVPHRTLTGFLTVAPWPMVPFLLPPLLHLAGLVTSPVLYAIPTVGAVDLIRSGLEPAAVGWPAWGPVAAAGYLAGWAALVLAAARRRFRGGLGSGPPRGPAASRRTDRNNPKVAASTGPRTERAARRRPAAVANAIALARLDLRNVRNDRLLILALGGPVLLAIALRLGYPGLAGLVSDRFGLDLAAYRPVLLAALVLLHVPMMLGMVGSLLLLDDLDERHLHALRATPTTLLRYGVYRLGGVAVLSACSLAVGLPLSGLATGYGAAPLMVSVVLAAAQSVLVLLVVAAFVGNKVEGLAVLKLTGGVLIAVPVAAWWTDGTAGWVLGLLPPAWPARALWAGSASDLVTAGLLGVAVTAAAGWLLARRALRRFAEIA